MTLPFFVPGNDPGPDFSEVLRRAGLSPFATPTGPTGAVGQGLAAQRQGGHAAPGTPFEIRHGTTICAVRYSEGVVMAGDRRATAGSAIAHRTMEKVHPADMHSGVAIAGAAGPALEMVRIFQLQLEHYEKVEGQALSLEGKANQLSQMVRGNLGMAMQGFVVVPLFAGYDLLRDRGRIYTYDPTGGRYEETDFHADGSGGRDARTTIKLGFKEAMSRAEGIELCVSALWQAADEDSATGGPDAVRGIYPTVATITAAGFERVPDSDVAQAFERVVAGLSSAERARPGVDGPTAMGAAATAATAARRGHEGNVGKEGNEGKEGKEGSVAPASGGARRARSTGQPTPRRASSAQKGATGPVGEIAKGEGARAQDAGGAPKATRKAKQP
jgi:proteasome beta subunit